MDIEPGKLELEEAYDRVKSYVHRTPILTSKSINQISDSSLFFKCENLQKVGAFKFRGACNAIFSMEPSALTNGVATHSSGNHAQALALAAAMKGVPAYIVMPITASSVKKYKCHFSSFVYLIQDLVRIVFFEFQFSIGACPQVKLS